MRAFGCMDTLDMQSRLEAPAVADNASELATVCAS